MTEYQGFLPEPELDGETDSSGRSLAQLAEQIAAYNPDVCGATATATLRAPEGADPGTRQVPAPQTAVTHPDLTPLVAVQWETGDGPVRAALESGRPAAAEDLLRDGRWPRYRARALEAGLRSSLTLPFRRRSLTVTVTLYGFRPGLLEDPRHGAAALLGDLATSGIVRDLQNRRMRAELEQLGTALHSRPVVDQACGIVMYVLGCDAETAFALLRRMSQHTNRKLSDLAAALVRTRGHGAESELVRLGELVDAPAGGAARRSGPHGRRAAAPDRESRAGSPT
ncbi:MULTISPECIES: ANTAR domain-containing response regulator [Streptomyces]|uniref:GAF and ANTAR domain-containing protein n=1 Tax=Streptomyces lycii TaxID=2654337 RepID=A0ABQ7FSH2_9ACTN|nr:GAF and ANTAR domain-containing protein [Streptomyces lycii]KAF4410633.1 GAF and ANTAR domain-containing protein [Streptomyces lycii]